MVICMPICIAICMIAGWIAVLVVLPVVVLADLCCCTHLRVPWSTAIWHFFRAMARGYLRLLASPLLAIAVLVCSCLLWSGGDESSWSWLLLRLTPHDGRLSCLRQHVCTEVILTQYILQRIEQFVQSQRYSRCYIMHEQVSERDWFRAATTPSWNLRIRTDDFDRRSQPRPTRHTGRSERKAMAEQFNDRPPSYRSLVAYRPTARGVRRVANDPSVCHPSTLAFAEAPYAAREMDQLICQPQMREYERQIYEALMIQLVQMPDDLCRLIASFTASMMTASSELFLSESVGQRPKMYWLSRSIAMAQTQSNMMDEKLYALVLQGYRVKEISAWSNSAALTVQLTFAPPDVLQLPADQPLTPAQAAACFTTPLYQPAGYAFKYPDDAHFWTKERFTAGGVRSTLRLEPGEFIAAVTCNSGVPSELHFHTSASRVLAVVSGAPASSSASVRRRDAADAGVRTTVVTRLPNEHHANQHELVGLFRTLVLQNDVISTQSIGAILLDRDPQPMSNDERHEEYLLHCLDEIEAEDDNWRFYHEVEL
jgi:hypothetical protein